MGANGTTIVDFGAFPGASDASVDVIGQTGIGLGSVLEAWIYPLDSADHSADEHMVESLRAFADASTIVPGTGFTIRSFNSSELTEPLESVGPSTFRSAAATVYGVITPSRGGIGTLIYGKWNIGWVWV